MGGDSWSTNTGGSTVVRYGTAANDPGQTAKAPTQTMRRPKPKIIRVHVKNLKPNTKYFFVVDSG
ncbi:MAG TPA: fibronectin type III domain-containing protein [Candidatus Angelobacter sp.]|nr:fibronectin type III domain-containing protein [Candidatus Angelobacter sp.]